MNCITSPFFYVRMTRSLSRGKKIIACMGSRNLITENRGGETQTAKRNKIILNPIPQSLTLNSKPLDCPR